jgi:hypothetical protein
MKTTQRQIKAWQIKFAKFFLTILLSGMVVKYWKFGRLICKQQYSLEFILVEIILFSVTGIVILERYGIFPLTDNRLFKHIHYAEWILGFLVMASTFVGFDGKLVDFRNLNFLDCINLTFNSVAVWLFPICSDIIIDSLKHKKPSTRSNRNKE